MVWPRNIIIIHPAIVATHAKILIAKTFVCSKEQVLQFVTGGTNPGLCKECFNYMYKKRHCSFSALMPTPNIVSPLRCVLPVIISSL